MFDPTCIDMRRHPCAKPPRIRGRNLLRDDAYHGDGERNGFGEETNMTMRKHSMLSAVATAAPLLLALPMAASADDGAERVSAHLIGFQETPLTLSSAGAGTFRAKIAENDQSFDWVLTFSGLTAVQQAHIHFGARALSGGISIFLCSNLGNGP